MEPGIHTRMVFDMESDIRMDSGMSKGFGSHMESSTGSDIRKEWGTKKNMWRVFGRHMESRMELGTSKGFGSCTMRMVSGRGFDTNKWTESDIRTGLGMSSERTYK